MKNVFLVLILLSCAACGKYGPPLPPSAYAPKGLQNIAFSLTGDIITVSWIMPSQDRRGKSLQSLDEVALYSRLLSSPTAELESVENFTQQQVFSVQDFVIKKESSSTIAPGVTANVGTESKTSKVGSLTFKSPAVNQPIQIVLAPINQGGVVGETSNIYQLTRKSDGSLETVSIPTEKSPLD